MRDISPNQKLPTIDSQTAAVKPNVAKIHIPGCDKDQRVTAICTPQVSSDLKDVTNDYVFLAVEKSNCQKKVHPLEMKRMDKKTIRNCRQIRIGQVLNPGSECGTAENRNNLTSYSAASGKISDRNLFITDSEIYHLNDGNDLIFYKADTTQSTRGGGLFCDGGANRGTLIGVHRGEGEQETNQGLVINKAMEDTLKKCAELFRATEKSTK